MTSDQPPRLSLATLQRAADTGALFLMYQPKLDLRSQTVTGVEALARWLHPQRGSIPPTAFIPVTERCGLIDWLTEWALTTGYGLRTRKMTESPSRISS